VAAGQVAGLLVARGTGPVTRWRRWDPDDLDGQTAEARTAL